MFIFKLWFSIACWRFYVLGITFIFSYESFIIAIFLPILFFLRFYHPLSKLVAFLRISFKWLVYLFKIFSKIYPILFQQNLSFSSFIFLHIIKFFLWFFWSNICFITTFLIIFLSIPFIFLVFIEAVFFNLVFFSWICYFW